MCNIKGIPAHLSSPRVMTISQQAIAERLGLSPATISRSLKGNPRISPETRARVLNAASAMGYDGSLSHPDDAATSGPRSERLSGADAPRLGVQSPVVSLLSYGKPSVQGYASVVRNRITSGMIEECRTRGLMLSLDYIDADDALHLSDADILPQAIKSGQSQGVLITGPFPDEALAQLGDRMPCVKVADYCPTRSIDCIDHDDMRSVELLVDHLWSQGHRQIGFIGGDTAHSIHMIRGNAYCLAMLRRGFDRLAISEVCRDVIAPTDDADAAFGWVREAIDRGVTGWIATNDDIGYRLLRYLAEHDVECPRDVSVCGFDHFDPPAGLPRLTSIDAPFEDMGVLAVARLHSRIRRVASTTCHTMIECDLKLGESTGPPRPASTK